MLTLIHGDDISASRKTLSELKLKFEEGEIITFAGSKVSLNDLVISADSLSLFENERLVVLENLITDSSPTHYDLLLSYLIRKKVFARIILWEEKEIGKTIINKYFKEAKNIICKLPKLLFNFIDSIGEKPINELLLLFDKLTKLQTSEIVFAMIFRQWRNLVLAGDMGLNAFKDLPYWQSQKFIKQSTFISQEKLITSYRQLLNVDWKVKSGQTPYNLKKLLDIFFISLYYEI